MISAESKLLKIVLRLGYWKVISGLMIELVWEMDWRWTIHFLVSSVENHIWKAFISSSGLSLVSVTFPSKHNFFNFLAWDQLSRAA